MSGENKRDYEVGRGKPPKKSQFKPGLSGNPGGRQRKRRPMLVPGELERAILEVSDMIVDIPMADGRRRKARMFDAIVYSIAVNAAKGKPTALRCYLDLLKLATHGRINKHRPVWLANLLQDMAEDPARAPEEGFGQMADAQVRAVKDLY